MKPSKCPSISAVALQSSSSQPNSNLSEELSVKVWRTSMPSEYPPVLDWPQQPSKSPSLSSWRTVSSMPSFHPGSNPGGADWPTSMPSEHPSSLSDWPTSPHQSFQQQPSGQPSMKPETEGYFNNALACLLLSASLILCHFLCWIMLLFLSQLCPIFTL